MAKTSVMEREKKRELICAKYRSKREKLNEIRSNVNLTDSERWEASQALQRLPRDSSRVRRRNRCQMCGRPRAFDRKTGLCRLHVRQSVVNGFVPGMRKASW